MMGNLQERRKNPIDRLSRYNHYEWFDQFLRHVRLGSTCLARCLDHERNLPVVHAL